MKKGIMVFILLLIPSMAIGLSFEPMTLDTGGKNKVVIAEDIDGDGNKDLIAHMVDLSSVEPQKKMVIFFADKNAKFKEHPTISINLPDDVCIFDIADIKGDGRIEIVLFYRTKVVTYSPTRQGFGKPTTIIHQGGNIFFPDPEQILYVDLARNWRGDDAIEIMLINFKALTIYERDNLSFKKAETLSIPMDSENLISAESGDEEIDVRRFSSSIKFPCLDIADYDADGDLDLYTIMGNVVTVFRQSDNRFEKKHIFNHTYKIQAPEEKKYFMTVMAQTKDIDVDGYGDLIIHKSGGSFSNYTSYVHIFKGKKEGLPKQADFKKKDTRLIPLITFPDADGDGRLDLVTPSVNFNLMFVVKVLMSKRTYPEYLLYLYNEEKIYPEKPKLNVKATLIIDEFTFPAPVVHGFTVMYGHDFTGDKRPDLLACISPEELGVFPSNGKAMFSKKPIAVIEAPSTYLIEVVDFNGDGHNDIFLWYMQVEEQSHIRIYMAKH